MKNYPRNLFLSAAIALSLAGTLLAFAQENPPAPPAAEPKAAPAAEQKSPPAPVAPAPDQTPATVTPPATPAPAQSL
ncbi:MAG TPA: hypothetical protein PLU52_03630, partial [Opitutaceae bacterium]|nr:hypothetical protein [Opitutaceae bacterium]